MTKKITRKRPTPPPRKLTKYEIDVINNGSAPWQLKCETCGATRRANEMPILAAKCAFCWFDKTLNESWSKWWELQFFEARAFGARGSLFGSHPNHHIYATKAARVALAAVLNDYKRDHSKPMLFGLQMMKGYVGEQTFKSAYQKFAYECLRDKEMQAKARIRKHHRAKAETVNQLGLFE